MWQGGEVLRQGRRFQAFSSFYSVILELHILYSLFFTWSAFLLSQSLPLSPSNWKHFTSKMTPSFKNYFSSFRTTKFVSVYTISNKLTKLWIFSRRFPLEFWGRQHSQKLISFLILEDSLYHNAAIIFCLSAEVGLLFIR